MSLTGYLRVRLGEAWLGLRVDQVVEVVEDFERLDAPGSHPAVMGVMPVRQGLVPLVRLAALIEDGDGPHPDHGMVVPMATKPMIPAGLNPLSTPPPMRRPSS